MIPFHGQGTYTYADGSTYVGDWIDDKPHGEGRLYLRKRKPIRWRLSSMV